LSDFAELAENWLDRYSAFVKLWLSARVDFVEPG
jgi:hypothetical protein